MRSSVYRILQWFHQSVLDINLSEEYLIVSAHSLVKSSERRTRTSSRTAGPKLVDLPRQTRKGELICFRS
jgi:hypothetical protein